MTDATVFNAYDVTQTAGPANAWVDNGSSGVNVPSSVTLTYTFSVIDGFIVDGLAIVRMYVSSGDWFMFGVNGATPIQFYSGPTTHDFSVTSLTEISYETSGYGDPVVLTLLKADYGYPELVPTFTPVFTEYRNTTEYEL